MPLQPKSVNLQDDCESELRVQSMHSQDGRMTRGDRGPKAADFYCYSWFAGLIQGAAAGW